MYAVSHLSLRPVHGRTQHLCVCFSSSLSSPNRSSSSMTSATIDRNAKSSSILASKMASAHAHSRVGGGIGGDSAVGTISQLESAYYRTDFAAVDRFQSTDSSRPIPVGRFQSADSSRLISSRQIPVGRFQSADSSRQIPVSSRPIPVGRFQSADSSRPIPVGRFQSADSSRPIPASVCGYAA